MHMPLSPATSEPTRNKSDAKDCWAALQSERTYCMMEHIALLGSG
jgi:hypothetical protein